MAVTKISDIIVPGVFAPYALVHPASARGAVDRQPGGGVAHEYGAWDGY